MIKFKFLPATRIVAPLDVTPGEPLESDALDDILAAMFPTKAAWLAQQPHDVLTISLLPDAPFGPDPRTLLDFLFDDFPAAVTTVRDRFSFRRVAIAGLHPARRFHADGCDFIRRPRAGVRLTLAEFHRLHAAAVDRRDTNGAIIAAAMDPSRVVCFYAPRDAALGDVLRGDRAVAEYLDTHQDAELRHPITGTRFDPSETTAAEAELVVFSDSPYVLRPARSRLAAFPYFDRRVALRRGRKAKVRVRPCNNCLACAKACPSGLYPSRLYHLLAGDDLDGALESNLPACVQCGRCSFVCPTALPLYERLADGIRSAGEEE